MQRAEKREEEEKRLRKKNRRKQESSRAEDTKREPTSEERRGEQETGFPRLSIYDLSLFYFRNFLTREGHYVSSSSSSLRKLRRNFRSTESASIGCAKGEKVPLQSGWCQTLRQKIAP